MHHSFKGGNSESYFRVLLLTIAAKARCTLQTARPHVLASVLKDKRKRLAATVITSEPTILMHAVLSNKEMSDTDK